MILGHTTQSRDGEIAPITTRVCRVLSTGVCRSIVSITRHIILYGDDGDDDDDDSPGCVDHVVRCVAQEA